MVDTVTYLNPEHSLVRVEPEGWTAPVNSNTWHQERIQQWLEGRTDEWDRQKEAYDNYQAIMSYEDDVAAFESAIDACNMAYDSCVADPEQTNCEEQHQICLGELVRPVKPSGYYTQEEVDASQAKWDAWNALPVDERGSEPVILKRPADLPIVNAPAVLIPNEITPYVKPVAQVKGEKEQELGLHFMVEANADVVSNGQTWLGGAESAMILNGQADKTNHRGNVSGVIHSKDHVAHAMTPNQIKDVAADVADAYEAAYTKYQSKLLELEDCGEDIVCINAITW